MSWVDDLSSGKMKGFLRQGPLADALTVLKMPEFYKVIRGDASPAPIDFNPKRSNLGHALGVGIYDHMKIGEGISGVGGDSNGSSIDEILARLQSLSDPSRYQSDDNSLRQQAMAAASAQYDPMIANLQRQMSQSETRANRNKDIIGSMFNQLADRTSSEVPAVQQQFQDTSNQVQGNYDQAQKQITDNYAQTQADQEAMYKRLNIEAAAPDIIPQQQNDAAFFKNVESTTNQTAQTAIQQEKQGAVDYTNQAAVSDRNEGTQRQADLMTQLQDLLQQYQGQIGDYQNAKNQTFLSNLGDLQEKSQTNALSRSQSDFNNYIATINLGRGLQSDQLDQYKAQQSSANNPVSSLSSVGSRAMSLGLNSSQAQSVQSIMNQAVLSDTVSGGTSGVNLTPEAKAAQIVRQGQDYGLSGAELNALQAIALEYFGRR